MKKITVFISALFLLLFTGCNSNDEEDYKEKEPKLVVKTVKGPFMEVYRNYMGSEFDVLKVIPTDESINGDQLSWWISMQKFYVYIDLHNVHQVEGTLNFDNARNLIGFVFPECDLEQYSMNGCRNIEKIVISKAQTRILPKSFSDINQLKKVVIPKDSQMTEIGEKAFFKCGELKKIYIPKNCNKIGDFAFDNCYNLKKVDIKSKTIEQESCFDDCPELAKINLPIGSNFTIKDKTLMNKEENKIYFFLKNKKMESYYIPDEIKEIAYGAFGAVKDQLKNLYNVHNETESQGVFSYLYSLESIEYADYETTAFSVANCYKLKSIKFSKNLKDFENNLFINCDSLECFTLPELSDPSDYSNYSQCFAKCSNLKEVFLPDNMESIPSYMYFRSTIEKIQIPENVQTIEQEAFKDCYKLMEIELSDSVQIIGKEAFSGCNLLMKVMLPENLSEIQNDAFYGCPSDMRVIYKGTIEQVKQKKWYSLFDVIRCSDGMFDVKEYIREQDEKNKRNMRHDWNYDSDWDDDYYEFRAL